MKKSCLRATHVHLLDSPEDVELTSVDIDSAAGIFTGQLAANLGGSFDNDADQNIFKATFGGSFGSLQGGGALGAVDLIYVPEPHSGLLLGTGLLLAWRRDVATGCSI